MISTNTIVLSIYSLISNLRDVHKISLKKTSKYEEKLADESEMKHKIQSHEASIISALLRLFYSEGTNVNMELS